MKHEQQAPFNNSRTPSQPGDQSARLLFCPVFRFAKQNGKRGKFVCLRPLNPMYVDRIGFSLYPHSFLIQSRGSIAVEIAVPARYNKIRTFFCLRKESPCKECPFLLSISVKGLYAKRREVAMKDHEIIELYWARNERAIAATAETYGGYCHAIAYNILHSREDAEECANDTYLSAWNSIPPQRPNRLSAYLGKITRNIALNRYKRYTAEKRGHGEVELVLSELEACIPAETSVERAIEEKELVAAINRFLYAQPKQNRSIFVRRYWHLCAIRDIADLYGMSESKVTSLLFRMRNEFRRFLEKEDITL